MDGIPESQKFQWVIPQLLIRKAEAQEQLLRLRNQIREETEPQQYKDPDEIWITPQHTRGDRERERRQRGQNYERQQDALERRRRAEEFLNNQQAYKGKQKQGHKRKAIPSTTKRRSKPKKTSVSSSSESDGTEDSESSDPNDEAEVASSNSDEVIS